MREPNATLNYDDENGKGHSAAVRISQTSYLYGVNSTESHSRLYRAFYPHRRSLGKFALTIDAKGYIEFRNLMNWLRAYAASVFAAQTGNNKGAITMEVNMPSRNFHLIGMLTSGIDDHDQVGSMVFSPQLQFMMLKDFNIANSEITTLSQVSQFVAPSVDFNNQGSLSYFPISISQYHDQANSQIYGAATFTTIDPTTVLSASDPTPPLTPAGVAAQNNVFTRFNEGQ